VDRLAETITPIISFEDEVGGARTMITGETFSISDSNTLDAINQDFTVEGQQTGLAIGLFTSNFNNSDDESFSAAFDGMRIVSTDSNPNLWTAVNSLDDVNFNAVPVATELVSDIQHDGTSGSFYENGVADNFAAQYEGQFVASVY